MVSRSDLNKLTGRDLGCNGMCCAKFFLPFPPEILWKSYQKYILTGVKKPSWIDLAGPMLIPLMPAIESGAAWWYTCKHWDTETRLCEIYEKRPNFCREYPNGDICLHCNSYCGTEKSKEVLPAGGIDIDTLMKGRNK
jgi:Fe-S-cluster containining protein